MSWDRNKKRAAVASERAKCPAQRCAKSPRDHTAVSQSLSGSCRVLAVNPGARGRHWPAEWGTLPRTMSFIDTKQAKRDQPLEERDWIIPYTRKEVPGVSDPPDKVFHTADVTRWVADMRALRCWSEAHGASSHWGQPKERVLGFFSNNLLHLRLSQARSSITLINSRAKQNDLAHCGFISERSCHVTYRCSKGKPREATPTTPPQTQQGPQWV